MHLVLHLTIDMPDQAEYFNRCVTCGRIFTSAQKSANYCSTECTENYTQCLNCGRFFDQKSEIAPGICSEDCSKQYVLAKGAKDTYILVEETV